MCDAAIAKSPTGFRAGRSKLVVSTLIAGSVIICRKNKKAGGWLKLCRIDRTFSALKCTQSYFEACNLAEKCYSVFSLKVLAIMYVMVQTRDSGAGSRNYAMLRLSLPRNALGPRPYPKNANLCAAFMRGAGKNPGLAGKRPMIRLCSQQHWTATKSCAGRRQSPGKIGVTAAGTNTYLFLLLRLSLLYLFVCFFFSLQHNSRPIVPHPRSARRVVRRCHLDCARTMS